MEFTFAIYLFFLPKHKEKKKYIILVQLFMFSSVHLSCFSITRMSGAFRIPRGNILSTFSFTCSLESFIDHLLLFYFCILLVRLKPHQLPPFSFLYSPSVRKMFLFFSFIFLFPSQYAFTVTLIVTFFFGEFVALFTMWVLKSI